jgi:hypothetical protein
MPLDELVDRIDSQTTRRTVVKTGAKLAYVAPLVAASFKLSDTARANHLISGQPCVGVCCPPGSGDLGTCSGQTSANCYCVATTEGSSACHEGGQSCAAIGACTSSAQCPSGSHCSASASICQGFCVRDCSGTVATFGTASSAGETSPTR